MKTIKEVSVMEEDKCPYCGSITLSRRSDGGKRFSCGTLIVKKGQYQSDYCNIKCLRAELTSLRTALEEMAIQRDAARRDVAVLKTKLHRVVGMI
jgi:hypothetical protein